MSAPAGPQRAPDRVLPTLNEDGSRRWLRPTLSAGTWLRRRRWVAYALMLVFFAVPYLSMNGKPLILLDLPRREFTLFGTTFLPTDTLLVMLLVLVVLILIFLLSALFGRVWCGWACPQTVYMEFLFRPIERLFEGGARGSLQMDRTRGAHPWRWMKHAVYALIAVFLSHTFLGYFVGIERLKEWVQLSPVEHPVAFLVMLGTTVMIFLDFAWFREQTCLVACPYGRIQSALLDDRSTIVTYDPRRGEPRMKGVRGRPAEAGDCVDCGNCVTTCPTGIDIREGLQMECIHCTQCIDACDTVMGKIGKPPGLIRYGSRAELSGGRAARLRVRTVLYPAALAVALGLFVTLLVTRRDADVTVLHGLGVPYTVQSDGRIVNQVRIKIANRAAETRRFRLELTGAPEATVIAPLNPLPVPARETRTTSAFVVLPREAFDRGEKAVVWRVGHEHGYHTDVAYRLVGPGAVSEERR
jgi:cytochrome c oxidase accessory protein FixG